MGSVKMGDKWMLLVEIKNLLKTGFIFIQTKSVCSTFLVCFVTEKETYTNIVFIYMPYIWALQIFPQPCSGNGMQEACKASVCALPAWLVSWPWLWDHGHSEALECESQGHPIAKLTACSLARSWPTQPRALPNISWSCSMD